MDEKTLKKMLEATNLELKEEEFSYYINFFSTLEEKLFKNLKKNKFFSKIKKSERCREDFFLNFEEIKEITEKIVEKKISKKILKLNAKINKKGFIITSNS